MFCIGISVSLQHTKYKTNTLQTDIMSEIANLKPAQIWRNFDALTQVPRPSGHLEKVQQFLLDFAKRVGVEAFKDAGGNIVMRKPATPGYENRKGMLLQAHMDMVPQKAPDSKHNFETDPIETYIEDGWVHAKERPWAPTMVSVWQPSWVSWKTKN